MSFDVNKTSIQWTRGIKIFSQFKNKSFKNVKYFPPFSKVHCMHITMTWANAK